MQARFGRSEEQEFHFFNSVFYLIRAGMRPDFLRLRRKSAQECVPSGMECDSLLQGEDPEGCSWALCPTFQLSWQRS